MEKFIISNEGNTEYFKKANLNTGKFGKITYVTFTCDVTDASKFNSKEEAELVLKNLGYKYYKVIPESQGRKNISIFGF